MKIHIRKCFLALMVILVGTVSYPFHASAVGETPAAAKKLTINFLNVGQADAEFIELPNGQNMLIDAGNNGDGQNIVKFIRAKGYSKIDYLIATHPHTDHIGGMADVVDTLGVGAIYMPNVTNNTKVYEKLLQSIQNKGVTVKAAKAGVTIFSFEGGKAEILAPNSDHYEELNDYSAVIKMTYQNQSFLFMADAQTASEREMLLKYQDLKADVLKVGHHGSNTSTSLAFLRAVSPKIAVISVGKGNNYGQPNQTILNKLNYAGIKTYRTDEYGTIVMTSDGKSLSVSKNSFATAGWLNTGANPNYGKSTAGSTNSSASAGKSTSTGTGSKKSTVKSVVISSVDKKRELVSIKNNSAKAVDMTGWVLVSVTGNQRYTFPSYVLQANGTVTIASGGASGNLVWTKENIWNNSGSDPAQLYDAKGKLISSLKI